MTYLVVGTSYACRTASRSAAVKIAATNFGRWPPAIPMNLLDRLPESAIATGLADYVLPVDQMPEATAVTRELGFDRVARRARRLISQEPLGRRLKRGYWRAELV